MRVEAPRRVITLDEVRAHRDPITRPGERSGVMYRGGDAGRRQLRIRDRVLLEAVAL